MEMYAAPVEGTYSYKTPNFDGTFRCQPVKVAVIGESEKQYLIRLYFPMGNHRPNDQMKVKKHNVKLHGMIERTAHRREYDYSKAFWNM